MTLDTLRIGTRGSKLALWQAEWVKSRLMAAHPNLGVELLIIKTTGDKILDVPLAKVGGKGLFVKEIEEALLAGDADIAVHSMKDVPTAFPAGLVLGPILVREDPRDALLSVHHPDLASLPRGAKVGSSSLRRQCQLLAHRPDLQILSLRGNVDTRIGKLEKGEFDAIVLAAAGVKRLQRDERVVQYLDPELMLPAIGQGAVGIELRRDDSNTHALVSCLTDPTTQRRVQAERALLAALEGGCQVPIAGHATMDGDQLTLTGLVGDLTGERIIRHAESGPAHGAEDLGKRVAQALLGQGAKAILDEVYHQEMSS